MRRLWQGGLLISLSAAWVAAFGAVLLGRHGDTGVGSPIAVLGGVLVITAVVLLLGVWPARLRASRVTAQALKASGGGTSWWASLGEGRIGFDGALIVGPRGLLWFPSGLARKQGAEEFSCRSDQCTRIKVEGLGFPPRRSLTEVHGEGGRTLRLVVKGSSETLARELAKAGFILDGLDPRCP